METSQQSRDGNWAVSVIPGFERQTISDKRKSCTIRTIYETIIYKKLCIDCVNLNQPKTLNSAKPNSRRDPSAKTFDGHLLTSTHDERKEHFWMTYVTHVSLKTELSYVENGCVKRP